jgi:hypothetical protein
MRDHKTIAVTLAAHDAATKHALAMQSDRKTVASHAILAFVHAELPHHRFYVATALIAPGSGLLQAQNHRVIASTSGIRSPNERGEVSS